MPTFTTIALENLLDRDSSSYTKSLQSVDNSKTSRNLRSEDVRVSSKHIYISPALYTTPPPAPIPEVSSEYSSSPSPYIVNHKGRRIGGFAKKEEEEIQGDFVEEEVEVSDLKFEAGSVNEGGGCLHGVESQGFLSAQSEFFDAKDEFSSDGSFSSGQSRGNSIGSEIRAIRLSLLEEIEKRKTAEDTLKMMHNQWQQISNLLSHVGLTLPALPIADADSLEQLIQEVIVTKFVAEAVGKAVARAEAELVSQTILEFKEQEVSRLRDRLQYYEAVNLEMSQRNQEIVEVTRRQRQKRQRQRKWLWSGIGLSIAIGATVIASSYLPATGKEHQLPSSGDPVDASTSSDTV